MPYTNLWRVKDTLRQSSPETTLDASHERFILQAMKYAVNEIDRRTERSFAPRIQTKAYDFYETRQGGCIGKYGKMYLKDDLLSLTSLMIDGVEIDSGDFTLHPDEDCHYSSIINSSGVWSTPSLRKSAIKITGTFGYRRYYSEAWVNSTQTTSNDPLLISDTVINVADVSGTLPNGDVKFSMGMMLKIEDEFLFLSGVDDDANTLTVERGYRGSTAVQHEQDAVIYIWYPEPSVIEASTDWSALRYKTQGNFEDSRMDGFGAELRMKVIPDSAKDLIGNYKRLGLSFRLFGKRPS